MYSCVNFLESVLWLPRHRWNQSHVCPYIPLESAPVHLYVPSNRPSIPPSHPLSPSLLLTDLTPAPPRSHSSALTILRDGPRSQLLKVTSNKAL
jgi:hypothetical protein